jgi:hypothetical protein
VTATLISKWGRSLMATTQADIRRWLHDDRAKGATHMIVAADTFNYEDYPVYIKPSEDVRVKEAELRKTDFTRVMEIYSFSMDLEEQLNEERAFNRD